MHEQVLNPNYSFRIVGTHWLLEKSSLQSTQMFFSDHSGKTIKTSKTTRFILLLRKRLFGGHTPAKLPDTEQTCRLTALWLICHSFIDIFLDYIPLNFPLKCLGLIISQRNSANCDSPHKDSIVLRTSHMTPFDLFTKNVQTVEFATTRRFPRTTQ